MNIKINNKWITIGVAFLTVAGAIALFSDVTSGVNTIIDFITKKTGLAAQDIYVRGGIGLIIFLLGILIYVLIKHKKNNAEYTHDIALKIRKSYLKLLRTDVSNRMRDSLHHAHYIYLNLTDSFENNVEPWTYKHRNISGTEDESISSISAITSQLPFSILLLGAPGGGKTTTMLKCIMQSVADAEQNENAPIPIFINLSTWRGGKSLVYENSGFSFPSQQKTKVERTADLKTWLVKTITSTKGVKWDERIVTDWVEEQKIILFLDGLDEAQEAVRASLIENINTFRHQYPEISVLICSRIADYEALVNTKHIKLQLNDAVTINPLTDEQISTYLEFAKVPGLVEFLKDDAELQKMAQSPLDLSIMVLAYNNPNFREIISQSSGSIIEKRIRLFDVYTEAMIQRPFLKKGNLDQQLLSKKTDEKLLQKSYKYLGWIARKQSQLSLSAFTPGKFYYYAEELYENTINTRNNKEWKYTEKVIHSNNIVNLVLLIVIMASMSLLYFSKVPWHILLLINTGTFIHFFLFKQLERNFIPVKQYVLFLPVVVAIAGTIYIPFGLLFKHYAAIVIFVILFAIGVIIISLYTYKASRKSFSGIMAISIITIAGISIPIVYLLFSNKIYPHWLFIYVLAVIANMALYLDFVQSGYPGYKMTLRIINLAILPVVIIAITLLKDHTYYTTLFTICLTVCSGLIFSEENQYNKDAIFVTIGGCIGLLTGLSGSGGLMFWSSAICIAIFYLFPKKFAAWPSTILNITGSPILILALKMQKKLPWKFHHFLAFTTQALLLKKTGAGYEFSHRRIRDYFAIREYIPLLTQSATPDTKFNIVVNLCALNDASCDVLLELIDDDDLIIRTECINGLGRIGTATAAQALLDAAGKTTGYMQELIHTNIYKIKDIAATPLFINILNHYPIDSDEFQFALNVLSSMGRLYTWENKEKIKASMMQSTMSPSVKQQLDLAMWLLEQEKDSSTLDKIIFLSRCDYFDNDSNNNELNQLLTQLSENDLVKLLSHQNKHIYTKAFRILYTINKDKATLEVLKRNLDNNFNPGYIEISTTDINSLLRSGENIDLILYALARNNYGKKVGKHLVAFAKKQKKNKIHLLILSALSQHPTSRSINYLLDCMKNDDLRLLAMNALLKVEAANIFYNKKLINIYFNFLQKDEYADHYPRILQQLTKFKSRKINAYALAHLKPGDTFLKAAIFIAGKQKIKKAVPQLLEIFHNTLKNGAENVDINLLEELLKAFRELNERSITPYLTQLYREYVELRTLIIKILVSFECRKEMASLHDIIAGDSTRTKYTVASFVVLTFTYDTSLIPEVIFSHLQDVNSTVYSYREYQSELKKHHKKIYLDAGDLLSACIKRKNYWLDPKAYAEFMFDLIPVWQQLNINNDALAFIFANANVEPLIAKDMLTHFVESPAASLDTYVNNQLLNGTKNKVFWIKAIDYLNIHPPISTLQKFSDDQDDEIASHATKAIIKSSSFNTKDLLTYLNSPREVIVQSTLEACLASNKKIDNLYEIILNNEILQRLLTQSKYEQIVRQLNINDIKAMIKNTNPNYVYLATRYLGILGSGSFIENVKELLNDKRVITIHNEKGHQTISEGAMYALEMIGSPSAKKVIDFYQSNR